MWNELDEVMCGVKKGEVLVHGSGSKVGKSMSEMADNVISIKKDRPRSNSCFVCYKYNPTTRGYDAINRGEIS